MKKLDDLSIVRPNFITQAIVKVRPRIKAILTSGKGDPRQSFEEKVQGLKWLISGRGLRPAGPAFGVYYDNPETVGIENIRWDACLPVPLILQGSADIVFREYPGVTVVSVEVTGSYDRIGMAIRYLEKVTQANSIRTSWPLTEVYLEEGENPLTELQFFVQS